MYETEANRRAESSSQIPADVIASIKKHETKIVSRTLLPWSEHCTECVWPTCYTTCELYQPRSDGRCQRFADGMVRIDAPGSLNGYLLKIKFKRWGKLWAPGVVRLRSVEEAEKLERRDLRIGDALQALPLPSGIRSFAVRKRYGLKKRLAQRPAPTGDAPTSFIAECYNPNGRPIDLSLTIRSVKPEAKIPFQKLLSVAPGFSRKRIPISEISAVLDLSSPFGIEIIPDIEQDGLTLFFGLMDFVAESALSERVTSEKKKKFAKCVVWDLDNTIWNGILIEDGMKSLDLKPGIVDVIKSLDSRGILQSVVSKNNAEDALQALEEFGLREFFLYPQISWGPKSEGVRAIAAHLNIGLDTFLFVDDQQFELEQVKAICPEVRVIDATRYRDIPGLPECDVPATEEAASRRKMYQVEAQRSDTAESFGDDYLAFLKHCNIKLNVQPLTRDNLTRVHELTQRTNQMNFSGNRYDKQVLEKIHADPNFDTYVLDCEDRYGKYGVVGFSIVDRREPRMTDLMFSCRIQSKRVEHAFVGFLIRKYGGLSGGDFLADYRKTDRNSPSGRVFEDVGMQVVEVKDGVSRLRFPRDQVVPDDDLILISVRDVVEGGS